LPSIHLDWPGYWTVPVASTTVKDMDLPGFRLHRLTGKEKNIWSVWVSCNWRVTFYFKHGDAYVIDYRDYH